MIKCAKRFKNVCTFNKYNLSTWVFTKVKITAKVKAKIHRTSRSKFSNLYESIQSQQKCFSSTASADERVKTLKVIRGKITINRTKKFKNWWLANLKKGCLCLMNSSLAIKVKVNRSFEFFVLVFKINF